MSESPLDSLTDMVWWMFDTDCVGMGAYRQFDYTLRGDLGSDLSPRLGDCYHLAVSAFTGWERFTYHRTYRASLGLEPEPQARANGLPAPTHLVHGTIHHREEEHRIGHAWVMLDNGDVWEPITGLTVTPCCTTSTHEPRTWSCTTRPLLG